MGPLTPPAGTEVYLDANCIIYSVERVPSYQALLQPAWDGARVGSWRICASELSLLETLVGPLRTGDSTLEADYRRLLLGSIDVRLIPISLPILEQGARLRVTTNLRTPDAIHAATALIEGCALFVTNDAGFRRVGGLSVRVLHDLLTP
jgi:predicted nucleic acid-binding protein